MTKILVVDDDKSILDVVSIILKDYGYKVIAESNGNETIRKVRKYKPNLILLDILMSGVDGRNICKRIKTDKSTKNIPVIMISAHPNSESSAYESGANAFLAKPFKIDDLISTVEKQLTN
jgi:CheY-like chemotaxis protein